MSFGIASSLLPVRIGPLQGEPFSGNLFVRDASSATGSPESLGSRLNEPGVTFLPLSLGAEVEMVHLGGVAYVECTEELPEVERLRDLGVQGEPVQVTLVSGETIRGRLTVMTPPGERRLSDLLNHADRFLLLAGRHGGYYVRREAILRVRSTAPRRVAETVGASGSEARS